MNTVVKRKDITIPLEWVNAIGRELMDLGVTRDPKAIKRMTATETGEPNGLLCQLQLLTNHYTELGWSKENAMTEARRITLAAANSNFYETRNKWGVGPIATNRLVKKYGQKEQNNAQNVQHDDYTETENEPSDGTIGPDFFSFLEEIDLHFDRETVEDLLLSLKAKPFVILSGGSGTGKTKLAQAYGMFISEPSTESDPVAFWVKWGKSAKSNGFSLNSETVLNLAPACRDIEGQYKIKIGNVESLGRLDLNPRLFFSGENKDELKQEIRSLGETEEYGNMYVWFDKTPQQPSSQKSYEIVPVGSNWTDSRPIVGYMNALTGEYLSTPALDTIEKANASGAPYLLILDEMNLSHVERYFSDILSAMESGEEIKLDGGRSVRIPGNLAVIGTVNMDETTYMFSPKVLDRANVIEFPPASIDGYLGEEDPLEDACGDVAFLQDPVRGTEVRSMKAREILDGFREGGAKEAADGIVSGLRSAQASMARMNLPFGYRTVDEVLRFMHVAWVYEGKRDFANWRRYFDAQIMQKVLPKIHGNSSLRPALEELRAFCETEGFPRSEAKLARMIGVLDSQRYVSFNC